MKKYKVLFTEKAKKDLKKLDKSVSALIIGWIEKNLENCENQRIYGKSLIANRTGQWRYRIGKYRLIAEIKDDEIVILLLNIGHRRDVYEK